jgi:hypothetical protein
MSEAGIIFNNCHKGYPMISNNSTLPTSKGLLGLGGSEQHYLRRRSSGTLHRIYLCSQNNLPGKTRKDKGITEGTQSMRCSEAMGNGMGQAL